MSVVKFYVLHIMLYKFMFVFVDFAFTLPTQLYTLKYKIPGKGEINQTSLASCSTYVCCAVFRMIMSLNLFSQ